MFPYGIVRYRTRRRRRRPPSSILAGFKGLALLIAILASIWLIGRQF